MCLPGVAGAQSAPAPANGNGNGTANDVRPPLGSTLTVEALGELPASASIFALLDTAVPDVIADRIDTGGLSAGQPARVGAHGSTWTQSLYQLEGADITDPSGSGTPLLIPGVAEWDRVEVATGLMPLGASAPGMAVSLVPRRAAATWNRWLDLNDSPSFLNATGSTVPPLPIARLDSWASLNLAGGGPVAERAGAFLSGTYTRTSHFERTSVSTLDANWGSVFVNLTTTPRPTDAVRVTGWFDRTRDPLEHHAAFNQATASERDTAFLTQFGWDHQLADGAAGLSLFGSYTQRDRATHLDPRPYVLVDRLTDGPVPNLLTPGDGTDRVLQVGGRVNGSRDTGPSRHHAINGGVDVIHSSSGLQPAFAGRVAELVNGLPARIWDWTDPAGGSTTQGTTLALFASDTLALNPRLAFNVGLRFEAVRGSAGNATPGAPVPRISWNDWYPRGGLHLGLTDFWRISTFLQFGRYGYRLPLSDLAYGNPNAPTGSIYRWNGGNPLLASSLGPLVQRIGPGSGGDPNFSGIDPNIRRPAMNEITFGFESRPRPSAFVRMVAIARADTPLISVVDVGVPFSTYTPIAVSDPGVDIVHGQPQTLIFFNRSPSTFGQDRYLLTNPGPTEVDDRETFVGVDLVGEVHAKRLFLIAGGTAGRSEAVSANRGYGPLENDAGILGEAFINPNARTYAQGRVFTERGYTLKTALSYQFDHDVTFGIVGRYEDGQHFARLVVLDTLNQGAEAVRAFRNGRTRFTFAMTVDARLQKGFAIAGHRLAASIDAYNLFNQALSVEEAQVTGTGPRQTTAVQPPRVVRIGVHVPF